MLAIRRERRFPDTFERELCQVFRNEEQHQGIREIEGTILTTRRHAAGAAHALTPTASLPSPFVTLPPTVPSTVCVAPSAVDITAVSEVFFFVPRRPFAPV